MLLTIMTMVMMTMISAMMIVTKYSLPTIDFATRYSTRYSDFLLQPYSNPTRSKKSLLVGAWFRSLANKSSRVNELVGLVYMWKLWEACVNAIYMCSTMGGRTDPFWYWWQTMARLLYCFLSATGTTCPAPQLILDVKEYAKSGRKFQEMHDCNNDLLFD